MRLKRVETGQRLSQKLQILVMRLMMPGRVPDVTRMMKYRPEFFGRPFMALTHTLMRESDEWSDAECELFAAFVSDRNQCEF